MATPICEGIEEWNGQELYIVETRGGDLQYMPRSAQLVMAIYGTFERTDRSTLLYTATIEREDNGQLSHQPDSEYTDDYRSLKAGNVDVMI